MSVRQATLADVDAIAHVHVEGWRSSYGGIVPDDLLTRLSVERRAEFWRQEIPRDDTFVFVSLDASAQIIGLASGGAERGVAADYDGELYAIYLLEPTRGQGYGRALVQASMRWLLDAGYTSMLVWVLADNQPGRGFYEHLGGVYVSEKSVTIGKVQLNEVSYGWPDLNAYLSG